MAFKIRSLGVKLITVGVLALVMTIPAFSLYLLVEDRSERAAEVRRSIGDASGGAQTFLGPVLAVPYTSGSGLYMIFPSTGTVDVQTHSEVRHRSLFKVPVYSATVKFDASFSLASRPANADAALDWNRAEIVTGASESRGALADITINMDGTTNTMGLSGLMARLPLNASAQPQIGLKMFGIGAGQMARPDAKFNIVVNMRFSGSQVLTMLPFARANTITIRGDWANPGFHGGFMPTSQRATKSGFEAHWSIPFIARGVSPEGAPDLVASLLPIAPVLNFVEVADPYQSVSRSLKYALLFLCLVFAAFFVFETTTGKRVHPAQYFLIGMAQLIFYLLLLSISERIGFAPAFAIAASLTVTLISANAGWIFSSRTQAVRAFAVFGVVYSLIYLLLTLEDEALLIGSVASFAAVALIMYFTRSVDWYGHDSTAANNA
jgi:inner membrane protein